MINTTERYKRTEIHSVIPEGIIIFAINEEIKSILIAFAQLNKAKSEPELSKIITSCIIVSSKCVVGSSTGTRHPSTRSIINKSTFEQKVDDRQFEHGDVFGMDVIVSTGEGKPKETGIKTTVYKRALETTYKLRTDSGRKLLSVVESNFYSFPFSFNVFDKEENLKLKAPIQNLKTTMKLGLNECTKYELLHSYPVLSEKKGEIVAQFKYTIAVREEGPIILAGLPLDVTKFESDKKVTDEKIAKTLESNLDDYLPNYKKSVKQEKKKKDNKAKRAAKKAAKQKRKEEEKKKQESK